MYYHEIETGLRLYEFSIQDRLLKRQITKTVITRIQYGTYQWDFPRKIKIAMGDPYINSDCDEIFFGSHLSSRGNTSGVPIYI